MDGIVEGHLGAADLLGPHPGSSSEKIQSSCMRGARQTRQACSPRDVTAWLSCS
jgi:hypothetical protein